MGKRTVNVEEDHGCQTIKFYSGVIFGIIISLSALSFARCQIPGLKLTSGDVLDRRCLDCFCYSMSGCNYSYGCHTLDKNVCGPYQLSFAYWLDGGKPGARSSANERDDYVACSTNPKCAERTIQNYNRLYQKDCNGNGVIDCVDSFRIHVAGPNLCNTTSMDSGLFWLKFLECYMNTAENTSAALHSIRIVENGQNHH